MCREKVGYIDQRPEMIRLINTGHATKLSFHRDRSVCSIVFASLLLGLECLVKQIIHQPIHPLFTCFCGVWLCNAYEPVTCNVSWCCTNLLSQDQTWWLIWLACLKNIHKKLCGGPWMVFAGLTLYILLLFQALFSWKCGGDHGEP